MDEQTVAKDLTIAQNKLCELKNIIEDGITDEERPIISETISNMLIYLYEMRDIVDGEEDLDLQE